QKGLMKVRFSQDAKDDLLEILPFVDAQGSRRGQGFRDEIRRCLAQIRANPESWPRVYRKVRIRIMRQFGFGIYYEFDKKEESILIGAIMHLKRRAVWWK